MKTLSILALVSAVGTTVAFIVSASAAGAAFAALGILVIALADYTRSLKPLPVVSAEAAHNARANLSSLRLAV